MAMINKTEFKPDSADYYAMRDQLFKEKYTLTVENTESSYDSKIKYGKRLLIILSRKQSKILKL